MFDTYYYRIKGLRNKRMLSPIILVLATMLFFQNGLSQPVDSTSFKLYTRFSFYSHEKNGEFLLHVPPALQYAQLVITIQSDQDSISSWKGTPLKKILRIPFSMKMKPSVNNVKAIITNTSRPGIKYSANTLLTILPYKPNEVKTDRLTGGLVVSKKPFLPFGFYCYSPVSPTLAEEEIVKGFNMMSPYQKIHPGTITERKVYMDRCAEIGMKVHYNLLSVSASTGPKADTIPEEEKNKRLVAEIKSFMNHPALLAWYISDEPNGFKIPPEVLEKIYNTVKEIDPWHPVTMVFMAPFMASRKYSAAFDIVMADPYPVPTLPISMVNDLAHQLNSEFRGKQPQWMVIQAFGGGEWWEREPTIQEIRSMTWQSVINGATGIQYFIRWGFNYFPKSAATWAECGRISLEIAELTPWLLSDEEPFPVASGSPDIIVTSKLYKGKLAVLAVNKKNIPANSSISIRGLYTGKARVLFENRTLSFSGGVINDQIAPFGSQVYMIDLEPSERKKITNGNNLIKDPGFENIYSPGIPSACYVRPGGDMGATYFTDSREYFDGNHSLRLVTPKEDKSIAVRFFPCQVKAGSSYMISLWAKSDPEQRFNGATFWKDEPHFENDPIPQYAEIQFGEFGKARFKPTEEWKRFVTFVTIPADTTPTVRTNLILSMPGQGVGWFDQIKVMEE
ncbi:MAG: hypothetical protein A2X04_17375 [Bacteroidetes bacterium GWF2_41_9]|nr:MAG: hypothetical protein A2X04_17375 [Bacteroidetes bacterium GWF2_41_9]